MTLLTFFLIVSFFVFIIGLCVGSFLNVVISRGFSNESIVFPGSKCPSCQTPLKWFHNIPIVSYLFLKGKCAFCEEKISIQYPIVELVTGLLFVVVFYQFGININAIFILIFVSLFVVLAATDIREKIVFDFHTYFLVIAGLIYNLFNLGGLYMGDKLITLGKFSFGINNSLIAAILGIILGIVVMEIFARFGYLVAGTRAFGEGDTYIAAGLGAILGWRYLIIALVYGFIIQIVLTVPVFIKKLYTKKDYKTLVAFLIFFAFLISMKLFENYAPLNNLAFFGILTLLLCASGFYTCKRILGGLKDQESFTYLPFGPALVLGGLITMFSFIHTPM
jgi:leader peptidase (prepilin peptidase) / N-methyltransferase